MNLQTIEMPVEEAKAAYTEYRHAKRSAKTAELNREDAEIARAYKALSQDKKVLNIEDAFRLAGEDSRGLPKIAIARADQKQIRLIRDWRTGTCEIGPAHLRHSTWSGWSYVYPGQVHRVNGMSVPAVTSSNDRRVFDSIVPNIPPRFRPASALSGYHILFEADWQPTKTPPDPALLKHLGGPLYAVLAVWDLTEVEQAVLGITRA